MPSTGPTPRGSRLGGPAERPAQAYRRLRLSMLEAEREVFLNYRDRGRLPDEVLRRVFHELDLEQANLESGAEPA